MMPGDRLVCAFAQAAAVGQRFEQWLLHVTIVPWFRLPDDSAAIADGLTRALQTTGPFEVVGAGAAKFGPHKNRPVRLLTQPTPLENVEAKVRTYLHKKRAWLVDETTKRQYDFRPHVTAQADASLARGETFRIEKLYIVEQKGDYKEVVSEVNFGKTAA